MDIAQLARDWWSTHPTYWVAGMPDDSYSEEASEVDAKVNLVLEHPGSAAILIHEAVLACPNPEAMSYVGTVLIEDAWHLSGVAVPEIMKLIKLEPEQYSAVMEGVLPSLKEVDSPSIAPVESDGS